MSLPIYLLAPRAPRMLACNSMGLPRRDGNHHDYRDYLTWPDTHDVRYELIDGVAYLMSPAPSRVHQEVVGELFRQIGNALDGKPCRAYVAPFDVRLPKGAEPDDLVDTVVRPDVLVVFDPAKLDARGMRGAPDWVIEVLSPSTAGHDQTLKLAVYERSGVRELWFVHPTDKTVSVYERKDAAFARPTISELGGNLASKILPHVIIDWARVLAFPDA